MDFNDNRPDPDELLASLKARGRKKQAGQTENILWNVCRSREDIYYASNSTG